MQIGGVFTNFRMPDLHSIGLGGGSVVEASPTSVSVGPVSVGCQLTQQSQCFGGKTLTATDAAVIAGLCDVGSREKV
jgi:N-methylhydantoinase A/oxoprolinase/acetone carboxylase beta subunit